MKVILDSILHAKIVQVPINTAFEISEIRRYSETGLQTVDGPTSQGNSDYVTQASIASSS
jgi:hypothetical protein